jgi:hypothetical protein
MRWRALYLGFFLVLSSSAAWSQEPPSSKIVEISYDHWTKLQDAFKMLKELQAKHTISLDNGNQWQIDLIRKLKNFEARYEGLLKELEKEKGFSESLLKKIDELVSELENSKTSLEKARSEALKISLSAHIAWSVDAGIGVGLVVYGIYKGDPVLVITGAVMIAGSGGHFILNLY